MKFGTMLRPILTWLACLLVWSVILAQLVGTILLLSVILRSRPVSPLPCVGSFRSSVNRAVMNGQLLLLDAVCRVVPLLNIFGL